VRWPRLGEKALKGQGENPLINGDLLIVSKVRARYAGEESVLGFLMKTVAFLPGRPVFATFFR
jgi:hypothetical protein